MKTKIFFISFIVTVLLITVAVFIVKIDKANDSGQVYENSGLKSKLFGDENVPSGPVTLDAEKEATHISKVAGTKDAYWMRGLPIIWNEIEGKKGKFNFERIDEMVLGEDDYFSGDAYHIPTVWPYANWDQKACRLGSKYEATGHLKEGGDLMMGAPCDLGAYAKFLEKVVERYDGDGEGDMPGLKTPIKHWEILNEPSMQGGTLGGAGEDLKFFVGTPMEYLSILKTSYETIKKADPEAKVAHAGMAGMQSDFVEFWTPIFEAGGGDYFDIANIHAISVQEDNEDLFVIKFKKFLEKYGLEEKPIWITEAQVGDLMGKPKDLENHEKLVIRSSIFALTQGADKIFMIENWLQWPDEDSDHFMKDKEGEFEKDKKDDGVDYQKEKEDNKKKDKMGSKEEFMKEATRNNSTHEAYLNLVEKINHFEKIETIKSDFVENRGEHQGSTSRVGQYKFISRDKIVYVLWGSAEVPAEISGAVKVTDMYGNSQELNAEEIKISDSPIFVEKI